MEPDSDFAADDVAHDDEILVVGGPESSRMASDHPSKMSDFRVWNVCVGSGFLAEQYPIMVGVPDAQENIQCASILRDILKALFDANRRLMKRWSEYHIEVQDCGFGKLVHVVQLPVSPNEWEQTHNLETVCGIKMEIFEGKFKPFIDFPSIRSLGLGGILFLPACWLLLIRTI